MAEEILGVDRLNFIEPSYQDMIKDKYTSELVACPGDQGVLLVDENSDLLALAIGQDGTGWVAGSFLLRRPAAALVERFEETRGEIFQEDRELWASAVREYYSIRIRDTVLPSVEDVNPERIRLVKDLLDEHWRGQPGVRCLDCCCGSGIGTSVLRDSGFSPLSYDIDEALLSLGLQRGRLVPAETMCIDATRADVFTGRAPVGLGLMFGMIHPLNVETWEKITRCLVSSVDEALITVGTTEEATLIKKWVEGAGCRCELKENTRDPIYDRWVCATAPKG